MANNIASFNIMMEKIQFHQVAQKNKLKNQPLTGQTTMNIGHLHCRYIPVSIPVL